MCFCLSLFNTSKYPGLITLNLNACLKVFSYSYVKMTRGINSHFKPMRKKKIKFESLSSWPYSIYIICCLINISSLSLKTFVCELLIVSWQDCNFLLNWFSKPLEGAQWVCRTLTWQIRYASPRPGPPWSGELTAAPAAYLLNSISGNRINGSYITFTTRLWKKRCSAIVLYILSHRRLPIDWGRSYYFCHFTAEESRFNGVNNLPAVTHLICAVNLGRRMESRAYKDFGAVK